MVLSFSFAGCSSKPNEEVKPTVAKVIKQKVAEPTQAEINAKIKKEATKADFVKVNGHENENKGKAYYVEGEVTFIDNINTTLPTFTVTTKEGTGFGMYDIMNFNHISVIKGDKVKAYGRLSGEKDDKGMIQMSGNIIEK